MRNIWTDLLLSCGLAMGSFACSDGDELTPSEVWLDPGVERLSEDTQRVYWSAGAAGTVHVRGATTPSAARTGPVLASVLDANEAIISGLALGERWYFSVGTETGRAAIAAERRLPLQGALNFRDIGGYRALDGRTVRWGLVFRSDALGSLTDADRGLLGSMGVRTLVDFRSSAEVARSPEPELEGVETLALPMDLPIDPQAVCASGEPVADIVAGVYRDIVDQNAALIGGWVASLADDGQLPAVSHCSAGTERTGIAIGLLLTALGVPEQTVLDDYALSGRLRESLAPRQRMVLAGLGCTPERAEEILSASPDSMGAVLAHVRDTHGSVEAYLESGGVEASTLESLRQTLLE